VAWRFDGRHVLLKILAGGLLLAAVGNATPPVLCYQGNNIVYTGNGNSLAGIQWTLTAFTGTVTATGAAAIAANKTLSCAVQGGGNEICVVSGLNQTVIGDGVIATTSVPASLAGLVAVNPAGTGIAIVACAPPTGLTAVMK